MPRKPQKRTRPNRHYVAVPGTGGRSIRIPIRVVEANSPQSFYRTRRHVEMGVEGECATCANAYGAQDALGGDSWVFTDSRAIKLKANKNGEVRSGILFDHNQGKFQKKFDRMGKKAMLASPECEGIVHLSVPRKAKSSGPSGSRIRKTPRNAREFRGARARFLRAGVTLPE